MELHHGAVQKDKHLQPATRLASYSLKYLAAWQPAALAG